VVLALLGGAWLLATLRLKRLGCTAPLERDIAIRLSEA
jgi:hypothetical protein